MFFDTQMKSCVAFIKLWITNLSALIAENQIQRTKRELEGFWYHNLRYIKKE